MNPSFNICQNDGCSITITGLSYEEGLYLDDTSAIQPYDTFKYKDTATINIVQLNKVDGTELVGGFIISHCSYLDELHLELKEDGYYTISHIILPTREIIEQLIQNDSGILQKYKYIYAVDNNTIVKLSKNSWIETDFIELTRNTYETNIFKSVKDMFATCNIWECYVNLCKHLLQSDLKQCRKNNSDISTLLFNRDVIWMTINVLTYYINKDQLYEAQRILEDVNNCNGFCNESNTIIKSGGCGCGR